jgi:hypothetical protein
MRNDAADSYGVEKGPSVPRPLLREPPCPGGRPSGDGATAAVTKHSTHTAQLLSARAPTSPKCRFPLVMKGEQRGQLGRGKPAYRVEIDKGPVIELGSPALEGVRVFAAQARVVVGEPKSMHPKSTER